MFVFFLQILDTPKFKEGRYVGMKVKMTHIWIFDKEDNF